MYAWLRRHQLLVDGTLALVLILFGLQKAVGTGALWQVPLLMIMVVPVTFRRKQPTTAFWIAVAGGGVQALTRGGPSPADIAIVVLLYTLAAYRPRSQNTSALLDQLFEGIYREGLAMPFTMEDFQRQYVKEHFAELTLEERREVLESLPPEERLAGLSEEQIRQFLDRLAAGRAAKPRKPRRKR